MRLLLFLLLVLVSPDDWGREWRELRAVKGWFSGGDQFVASVDAWNGRKHELMAQLGHFLGDGTHTVTELKSIMGEPDAVDEDRLVYFWRGRHDFLWFRCQGDRVLKSGWWMAGE